MTVVFGRINLRKELAKYTQEFALPLNFEGLNFSRFGYIFEK